MVVIKNCSDCNIKIDKDNCKKDRTICKNCCYIMAKKTNSKNDAKHANFAFDLHSDHPLDFSRSNKNSSTIEHSL